MNFISRQCSTRVQNREERQARNLNWNIYKISGFKNIWKSFAMSPNFMRFPKHSLQWNKNVEQKKWKLYSMFFFIFYLKCIYRTSNALVWFLFKFPPQFIIFPLCYKRLSWFGRIWNYRYIKSARCNFQQFFWSWNSL